MRIYQVHNKNLVGKVSQLSSLFLIILSVISQDAMDVHELIIAEGHITYISLIFINNHDLLTQHLLQNPFKKASIAVCSVL